MLRFMKRIYCLSLLLLLVVVAWAQEATLPVRYSFRDGAYLYFADRALGPDAPYEKITAVRISRNSGKGLAQRVTVSRPTSASAFRQLCGESAWSQLKLIKTLRDDNAAWEYIRAHALLSDYGTLSFDMAFRQAMGTAYLDKEAAGLAAGKSWTYQAELLDAAGRVVKTVTGTITGGQTPLVLARARRHRTFATDSVVSAQWYILPGKPYAGLLMADVYRQDAGKGAYKKLPSPLFAVTKGDSLLFYFQEPVRPGALYRYYIRPTDDLGNAAQPSDTVSLLAVDFASLPLLRNVQARDTANGIALQWAPIGDLPYVVGVEIQRSRDARGDYVVIDTVEASRHTYFDKQVFPDIPYYYRFRTLALKGRERNDGYTGYATASVKNTHRNPDPPYGLRGTLVKGKVQLRWQPVPDTDVYGYYVYRSVSGSDRFEVLSNGLQTTEYTDTSSIGGRTQYVYGVKAVNRNSLESDFSNLVTMRQSVLQLPQEPAGVNAWLNNHTVVLDWPSAARADYAVAGYTVYRREAQPANAFDMRKSAAAQAVALKFVLLTRTLQTTTHFEDAGAEPGKTYEYAVASVDVFGAESTFSPFARVAVTVPTRVVSTCTVRKVTAGVELAWEPSFTRGAATVTIYRKKAGEASYQKAGSVPRQATAYVDKTTQKGTLYTYVISAEAGLQTLARSEEKNIRY